MLDANEISALATEGHEIGAHTCTHPKLTTISSPQIKDEVFGSKWAVERLIGQDVVSFAYPHGQWNYNVREIVSDAGFLAACTTEEAHIPDDPDSLALPRLAVLRSTTVAEFRTKLARGLHLYSQAVHALNIVGRS